METEKIFTIDDLKSAFNAGINRGIDITLIVEHNGDHSAIGDYPNFEMWINEFIKGK